MLVLGMRINRVMSASAGSFRAGKNEGGIYVRPAKTTKKQEDTINRAMSELKKVEFSGADICYMQNLGVSLPFKNGREAVEYLNNKNINVRYAEFSNPQVHACLDTTGKTPDVLINSNYKDLASDSDVLAISEAIMHEAGHAKDEDSENSIQEEIDCLALNVLAHRHYERAYPDIYRGETLPLYSEGVSLYPDLFFDEDYSKGALKRRVSEKYGFLDVSSPGHAGSKMAWDVKNLYKNLQENGVF